MAIEQHPIVRFYQVRVPGRWGWARIFLTSDGSISILSDWGYFGHWFDGPGCEFRLFLTRCDSGYLANKFLHGEREFQAHASMVRMREFILQERRARCLTKEEAREEWDTLEGRFESKEDAYEWYYHETNLPEQDSALYERFVYDVPRGIREFLSDGWPVFVGMLKEELAREAETASRASGFQVPSDG